MTFAEPEPIDVTLGDFRSIGDFADLAVLNLGAQMVSVYKHDTGFVYNLDQNYVLAGPPVGLGSALLSIDSGENILLGTSFGVDLVVANAFSGDPGRDGVIAMNNNNGQGTFPNPSLANPNNFYPVFNATAAHRVTLGAVDAPDGVSDLSIVAATAASPDGTFGANEIHIHRNAVFSLDPNTGELATGSDETIIPLRGSPARCEGR